MTASASARVAAGGSPFAGSHTDNLTPPGRLVPAWRLRTSMEWPSAVSVLSSLRPIRPDAPEMVIFICPVEWTSHEACPLNHRTVIMNASMTTLDINQIKEILPHRFPLLLVDRIVEMEAERIVG